MRVAIIGAGLAGISCAHELERNGIKPEIFNDQDFIGERLNLPVILLNMFNIPIKRPLAYLTNKYAINLKPDYLIKEAVLVSCKREYVVRGNIGYIFRRGMENGTMLHQILPDIKTQIHFNTHMKIKDIKNQFDHILVSTAEYSFSKELNIFNQAFNAYVRVANVQGRFKTDSIKIWFNTDYTKHGFAYLVPDSEENAKLVHVVDNTDYLEYEKYWNNFINNIVKDFEITDVKDIRHDIGTLTTVQHENLYFAGVAGGFIDNFLGFGSLKAVISGASAAYCMVNRLNYNDFMHNFIKDIKNKQEIRKAFNRMDNEAIDKAFTIMTTPGIKQFIYNNPTYRISQTIPFIKLYNRTKGNN